MSTDLAKLRQTFTRTLILTSRQWRRMADRAAQTHGLSDATALPLILIGHMAPPPTQTALAEVMGVECASLVRPLDQLSAADLVERREDPNDRRAKTLSLTPEGEAIVAEVEATMAGLRQDVLENVSAADLKAALRVLQAIQTHAAKLSDAEETEAA
ncbi:MarR family transcriptional regulator [Methyloligella sp. 2.7D]|uniref:MarR family winged helix-turn-helix transcriptional regulator n=1 Tax=unclassified Methyloligella TaxID=2625955 RepID=UPI00157D3192|nr:MarR family transcriptional regulator [Methyloligella sp. GL2]QKP77247.1 winged helix DNA-binding protein [Methyloligella sp. GL2]